MKSVSRLIYTIAIIFCSVTVTFSQADSTLKIFQFPADKIPRIDGNIDDWSFVPDSYIIGNEQLRDDEKKHQGAPDPKNLEVKVKVGWVKGLNRLYFLYEAYDNYWDFSPTDLNHDIFEIVVDGDQSGGSSY